MWSWRAFGASALFALALLFPCTVSAQNHQLRVPVSLEGLPPTLDRLWGFCRFTDAAGVETYGGNIDRPIADGRFVDTVTFDMTRNARRGGDTPDGYYCHLRIMGRTASGESVTFSSDGAQAALGWRNMNVVGGRGYYLPSAPGTMISRIIRGRFEKPEQAAPPASTNTECPCGCTASGGAAACSTDTAPPPAPASSPSSPTTPPPLRLPTPISPSRVTTPSPAPLRAGATLPTGRIDVTTSPFAYTGTGVIVAGP